MFQERRILLGEVWDHYKSLADQLGKQPMIDKESMMNCCPGVDELIFLGLPLDRHGQELHIERHQEESTGEVKVSLERTPGSEDVGFEG